MEIGTSLRTRAAWIVIGIREFLKIKYPNTSLIGDWDISVNGKLIVQCHEKLSDYNMKGFYSFEGFELGTFNNVSVRKRGGEEIIVPIFYGAQCTSTVVGEISSRRYKFAEVKEAVTRGIKNTKDFVYFAQPVRIGNALFVGAFDYNPPEIDIVGVIVMGSNGYRLAVPATNISIDKKNFTQLTGFSSVYPSSDTVKRDIDAKEERKALSWIYDLIPEQLITPNNDIPLAIRIPDNTKNGMKGLTIQPGMMQSLYVKGETEYSSELLLDILALQILIYTRVYKSGILYVADFFKDSDIRTGVVYFSNELRTRINREIDKNFEYYNITLKEIKWISQKGCALMSIVTAYTLENDYSWLSKWTLLLSLFRDVYDNCNGNILSFKIASYYHNADALYRDTVKMDEYVQVPVTLVMSSGSRRSNPAQRYGVVRLINKKDPKKLHFVVIDTYEDKIIFDPIYQSSAGGVRSYSILNEFEIYDEIIFYPDFQVDIDGLSSNKEKVERRFARYFPGHPSFQDAFKIVTGPKFTDNNNHKMYYGVPKLAIQSIAAINPVNRKFIEPTDLILETHGYSRMNKLLMTPSEASDFMFFTDQLLLRRDLQNAISYANSTDVEVSSLVNFDKNDIFDVALVKTKDVIQQVASSVVSGVYGGVDAVNQKYFESFRNYYEPSVGSFYDADEGVIVYSEGPEQTVQGEW